MCVHCPPPHLDNLTIKLVANPAVRPKPALRQLLSPAPCTVTHSSHWQACSHSKWSSCRVWQLFYCSMRLSREKQLCRNTNRPPHTNTYSTLMTSSRLINKHNYNYSDIRRDSNECLENSYGKNWIIVTNELQYKLLTNQQPSFLSSVPAGERTGVLQWELFLPVPFHSFACLPASTQIYPK